MFSLVFVWGNDAPPGTVGDVRFANVFFGVSPARCACVVHHMQHRGATQFCNQGRREKWGTIFQGPGRIGRAGRVGQVGEAGRFGRAGRAGRIGRAGRVGQVGEAGRFGRAGRAGEVEGARQVGVGLVNN